MNSELSHPPQRIALQVNEACTACGLSRGTLYNAINAGELSTLKVGKRTLIETTELRRWLKSKRRRAA